MLPLNRTVNVLVFLAVALPGFGPEAATDQLRLFAVYLIALCSRAERFDPICLFIIWAAMSLAWSPDAPNGVRTVINMGAFYLAWNVLRKEDVTLGIIAALIVSFIAEIAVTRGIYGNPNFTAELFLIASGYLWWKLEYASLPFIGPPLVYLAFQDTHLQWLVLGGLVWLGFCYLFLKAKWEYAIYTLLLGLTALTGLWGWDSVMVRMEIWHNVLQLFIQSPLQGYGVGGLNYLYDTVRENHMALFDSIATQNPTSYVGAVHNEYLQILAEFGIIGFALIGLALYGIKWNPCLTVAAILSLTGFPLQNPQTAVIVVSALCLPSASWSTAATCWRRLTTWGSSTRTSIQTRLRHFGKMQKR